MINDFSAAAPPPNGRRTGRPRQVQAPELRPPEPLPPTDATPATTSAAAETAEPTRWVRQAVIFIAAAAAVLLAFLLPAGPAALAGTIGSSVLGLIAAVFPDRPRRG
ncbi:hypothetical protein FHR83_002030 [Actinoplanes campanulatus]|uniref:Uncharacterized protein n=1 Tax=Actinoplanes campanulatus TaxID=113559 RepID=A0A7W5ADL4_9ACTN|nr:hypothetical protein [Actinoplanes campanulatus]MBB3094378.1 hypothetical protein [Actinoplanes campanulatus]GGN20656.1 hypothetical protein GCM10010109_34430 [Actinoplanes campanulatus]GID35707.1 hypothetical protein Aca09nite_22130 [Actinoplanes campanulatus]